MQSRNANAIVEILSERASVDGLVQVVMRRRDNADVDLARPGLAEARDLPLLQDSEQLRLHTHWHIADFVKKDGATICSFKQPCLV